MDDARINIPVPQASNYYANVSIRYLKPNDYKVKEKLVLCIFGPDGTPISDNVKIKVGFHPIPEPIFLEQAQEMAAMGLDFNECVKALKRFGGNIEQALDNVLNQL